MPGRCRRRGRWDQVGAGQGRLGQPLDALHSPTPALLIRNQDPEQPRSPGLPSRQQQSQGLGGLCPAVWGEDGVRDCGLRESRREGLTGPTAGSPQEVPK